MTVEEACRFFDSLPSIRRKIETLRDVGLGYIKLGQPSTTLSGGEAQRVKLATELSRQSTGKTIYVLDEPTTGLHFADVHKLTEILQRLTEGGNTVVTLDRVLSGSHQDGRLYYRYGTGRRRGRRNRCHCRNAGRGGCGAGILYRTVFEKVSGQIKDEIRWGSCGLQILGINPAKRYGYGSGSPYYAVFHGQIPHRG